MYNHRRSTTLNAIGEVPNVAAARAAVEARQSPGASSRRRAASPEAEEPLGPAAPESNGAEPHGLAAAEASAHGGSLGVPRPEPVDGVAHGARGGGPAARGQVWMKHQLPGHELQARSDSCADVLTVAPYAQLLSGCYGIKKESQHIPSRWSNSQPSLVCPGSRPLSAGG